jgi:galactose mutarotase-like enzyme
MESIEYSGHTIKRWTVGSSVFTALPEIGARLMSWNLNVAGKEREVICWPYGTEDFTKLQKVRGGNPILFPFSARTFDGDKLGYWEHNGVHRKMQMHGYARAGEFVIADINESGFRADFKPCAECQEAYPFKYKFSVEYRFKELSMEVDLILANHDNVQIPWSAGHHFYFKLPWHVGAKRSDYAIEIPAKKAFYHGADGKLNSIKGFSTNASLSDVELVDRIHTKLKTNVVKFGPKSGEENVVIKVSRDPVPPSNLAVVTWTENADSPFYCVEPWMGPPNSPSHKNGLYFVDPGETGVFSIEIILE